MNTENECQICGLNDKNCQKPVIGWYYGANVCEACKKFFIRSEKDNLNHKYKCINFKEQCLIMITTRNFCQFCRYQKCKNLGMDIKLTSRYFQKHIPAEETCLICPQIASGIHFGVLTCEGCKGFFRRSNLDDKFKSYKCKSSPDSSVCQMSSCQFCRYEKCIKVGMSTDKSKTGRRTNMFKHQQSGLVINKTAQKRNLESDENPEPKNKRSKKSVLVQDINHQNIKISNQINNEENGINAINEPIVFFYDTNLINFNINHSNWLKQINKENSNDVSIDNSNAALSNESSNSLLNDETQSYSNNYHSNLYQFSSAPMFTFCINPNLNINLEQGFISLNQPTDQ